MALAENKLLVTGGAAGIGLEFSKLFLSARSGILVCGNRFWKISNSSIRKWNTWPPTSARISLTETRHPAENGPARDMGLYKGKCPG